MVNKFLPYLMEELNCGDIGSLTKRIILQKKVYLLQKLGFNIGYTYQWYWYGPYSVALNLDSFNVNTQIESEVSISEDQNVALGFFHNLVKGNENNLRFLETAASLTFLKEQNPSYSDRELVNVLVQLKSHISVNEAEEVLTKLKQLRMV